MSPIEKALFPTGDRGPRRGGGRPPAIWPGGHESVDGFLRFYAALERRAMPSGR